MRPASWVATLAAGAVAVLSTAVVGAPWATVAGAGLAVLLAGLATGRERLASAGGVVILVAVGAAGLAGLGPGFVLLGTLGAVLAWDAGTHGIGIDADVTAEGLATRAELVHAGATLFVLAAIAGVTYAVTVFGGGLVATSAAALVLLAGVVLLAVGLEPRGAA